MAYAHLNAETREIAERVLTRKQLDAFKLRMAGVSMSVIARTVGVSEPVARRTVNRALQLIELELERSRADESSAA